LKDEADVAIADERTIASGQCFDLLARETVRAARRRIEQSED